MEKQRELLIDDNDKPIIYYGESEEFNKILRSFIQCYIDNPSSDEKSVRGWLEPKMTEMLPDTSSSEISTMVDDIIITIKTDEQKKASLKEAVGNGRSKNDWFANEVKESMSGMATQEAMKYMNDLDVAVQKANEHLYKTITTQEGMISQNPRLEGFIAEQYHAQTFNMNAEAKGSPYRAKVLEPEGKGYAKNSVDIVIVDENDVVVRRYQSKYCKDAKATEQAFENGDYRGQQKLVPDGQSQDIKKKSTTVIEAPDGTQSNPLTKSRANQMRDEAQSGQWKELNWNEYVVKDLAVGIGKQTGQAALQGAIIGIGFDVAHKLWNDEEIEPNEVIKNALASGADFGLKTAAAGALTVGVKKEIITVIPKGTPASTIANIAFVAIEDIKVLGKITTGELSVKEGLEQIEETTVSTAAGLIAMGKGASIGAEIGTVFGPVGIVAGGLVGGAVGYMAGSKFGEAVVECGRKIRNGASQVIKKVASKVLDATAAVADAVSDLCSNISLFFGF